MAPFGGKAQHRLDLTSPGLGRQIPLMVQGLDVRPASSDDAWPENGSTLSLEWRLSSKGNGRASNTMAESSPRRTLLARRPNDFATGAVPPCSASQDPRRVPLLALVFPARSTLRSFLWAGLICLGLGAFSGPAAAAPAPDEVRVVETEGTVEISRARSPQWDPAHPKQVLVEGDRLKTGPRSRAVLRLSNLTTYRVGERTLIQIPGERRRHGLNLMRGVLYFFHRDKPQQFPVRTPTAYAVVLGTEFSIHVATDDTTTIQMLDGQVEMTNAFGRLTLQSGQAGRAAPGQKPDRTAVVEAVNLIQWCLYYPGVLDVAELDLAPAEQAAIQESLAAYRDGDLLAAMAAYPADRTPDSDAERLYLAALLLSVGQVPEAESTVASLSAKEGSASRTQLLAGALRTVIAAVKGQPRTPTAPPALAQALVGSATLLVAESYYHQSQGRLKPALLAARQAARQSPGFAFAWARLAEMEFSFGETKAAAQAVEKSLALAPRNAQAWALQGFLLAAQNKLPAATAAFDQALAIDGALGNAWLGRGLCRIRQGNLEAGREDLQVAATVEPQRALLRSYLGKAFGQAGEEWRGLHELDLAKRLDRQDPTPWLYSGLLLRQENRVNEAIRQLERSQELNQNRRVYRSDLLLDGDRAVRGVNQALLYQDAGMVEVSAREAGRALEADYANYSAHLFLAESYQGLRDPKGISQRYETPTVNEYLLANLLAPVGAGTLAQSVSQQEYSKLFESDGLGLSSLTEYLSNGDWLESAAQYGTFGRSSYALSGFYRFDNGQRPNNEFEQTELSLQLKQEITAQDSLYLQAIYGEAEGGDVLQRYDPNTANPGLKFDEHQEPILLAGYHRAWSPSQHTLFLASWLNDEFHLHSPQQRTLLLQPGIPPEELSVQQQYRNELEIYTAELQQLWQTEKQSLTVGGRYQAGTFDTSNQHTDPTFVTTGETIPSFFFQNGSQTVDADFERLSLYGYYRWHITSYLQIVAGLCYDQLTYPEAFRFAPLVDGEDTEDQLSPKAGVIWTPTDRTTFRIGYAQSLGGVSFDQSFRLEPTQVAGFNQAYRSLIPESVAGANASAHFDSFGVSLEQKFGTGTYLGLRGEWLQSQVDREFGVYDFSSGTSVSPTTTPEQLDYEELALTATLNQLVGEEWAFGARYLLSQATLRDEFPDLIEPLPASFDSRTTSLLHQLKLFAIFNHRSGFFAQGESLWYLQSNHGYSTPRPGDDFWQFNAFIGYRFPRRHAEIRLGLLNITDQDYRLNPLNLTAELPRDRTLAASLRFNF